MRPERRQLHAPQGRPPAGRPHQPASRPAPRPSDSHCVRHNRQHAPGAHLLLPLAVAPAALAAHQGVICQMEVPHGRLAASKGHPAPGVGKLPDSDEPVPHPRDVPDQSAGDVGTGAADHPHGVRSTSCICGPREQDFRHPPQRTPPASGKAPDALTNKGPRPRDRHALTTDHSECCDATDDYPRWNPHTTRHWYGATQQ